MVSLWSLSTGLVCYFPSSMSNWKRLLQGWQGGWKVLQDAGDGVAFDARIQRISPFSLSFLIDLTQEFWNSVHGAVGCCVISIPLCRGYAYHMLSRGHQVIIHWPLAQLITEPLEEIISDKTLDLTILHSATFVKLVDKTAAHWQHKRQSAASPPPLSDTGWSILSPDTFLVLTELVRGPCNDFQSFQVAQF